MSAHSKDKISIYTIVEVEAQSIVEVRKPRLAGIAWAKVWRGADLMQSHVETLQLLMPTMFSDHGDDDDNHGENERTLFRPNSYISVIRANAY